jgi:hypothetical protein
MYAPAGTNGKITDLEYGEYAPTVCAFAQFVGKPGEKAATCFYQMASINGPEAPIEYSNSYKAEISEDCVFETLASEDLEDWKIVDFAGFTEEMKDNDAIYIDSLPNKAEFDDSFELENDLNFENSFCCHLGFDKDGKINYIRPVIMD